MRNYIFIFLYFYIFMFFSPYKFITLFSILYITVLFSMPGKDDIESSGQYNPTTKDGMLYLVKLYENDKKKLSKSIKHGLIQAMEQEESEADATMKEIRWYIDSTNPEKNQWMTDNYIRRVDYYIEDLEVSESGIKSAIIYLRESSHIKYLDDFLKKEKFYTKRIEDFKRYYEKAESKGLRPISEDDYRKMEKIVADIKNEIKGMEDDKLPKLARIAILLIKIHGLECQETAF